MPSLSFPDSFPEHLHAQPGVRATSLLESLNSPAPVSVRLHPWKPAAHLPFNHQVPWCTRGYYLTERPMFYLDPAWHAGAYYVQEASSMFLEWVLGQLPIERNIRALDACAAPGGKSLIVADFISSEGLLVSNEVIKTRVPVLSENMVKWGSLNTLITSSDVRAFQQVPGFFDLMLVDAPCSGSGLFRKDPDARSEWSLEHVQHCAVRQQRILLDLLPALKKDGWLIYATCSYSSEENEEQVAYLQEKFNMSSYRLQVPEHWGIAETVNRTGGFGYRFSSDQLDGEGFFLSVLKADQYIEPSVSVRPFSGKEIFTDNTFLTMLMPYLQTDKDVTLISTNGSSHHLLHRSVQADVAYLLQHLQVRLPGIDAGSIKANQWIPSHALAMSNYLHPSIPKTALNLNESMAYLRREDLDPAAFPQGWSLVTHQGLNLGWIKKVPHRINNYYPMEYRLRK